MTQKWKEGQEGRGEGWRGYKNKVPSVSVVKTWPANDMAWTSGCHLQRMKLPLHGKQQRQQLRGKNKNKNNKTQPNFASLHFAIWYSNWPRRHSGMSDNKGLDEKVSSSQIPEGNVSWPAQKKKKRKKTYSLKSRPSIFNRCIWIVCFMPGGSLCFTAQDGLLSSSKWRGRGR